MPTIQECLSTGNCTVNKPPERGAVMSPFVKLTMQASGVVVTVGNDSSPQNGNSACIKEFEFGFSERPIARVVIHDEQGSSWVKFMENLLKNLKCLTAEVMSARMVRVEFGWIKVTCEDITSVETSGEYFMMINHIVCNFDGGKLIYELELTDLMAPHAEARVAKIQGADGDKGVYLTDAITNLLRNPEYPPSVAEVEFLRLNKDGKGTEKIVFKYHDDDETRGELGKWVANNTDKLNTILEWLSGNVTNNEKSFILMYDSKTPGGKIIIWEDPKASCNEITGYECIRKYIVNGGKDSRVISFNPKFKWSFAQLTSSGGVAGGKSVNSNPTDQSKNSGSDCQGLSRKDIKTVGAENTFSACENRENVSGKKADQQQMETNNAMAEAYYDITITEMIQADLVIVGDPSLPTPLLMKFRPISIIFINPFHLRPTGGSGCPDWLAAPFCNEVLTNKNWLIKGVTHLITDGKFTTTINVMLPAPGATLAPGQPLGGSGSGGWVPPTCP